MAHKRLAVITDGEHPGLRPDDVGLDAAFAALGVEVTPLPWGQAVPDTEFDAALIRTPWDYFTEPEAFLSWAESLSVPVLNSASTLRWNHDKRYLLELAQSGAARLPATELLTAGEAVDTRTLLRTLGCERAVVKPAVSGGAFGTRVVSVDEPLVWGDGESGPYLAQAFVDAVTGEGEWSLTYFGGALSHSVRKVPKEGDFRVQDDFGGAVLFEEAPAECVLAAEAVLAEARRCLSEDDGLTYARVDLVRDEADAVPLLMELELIEPELGFQCAPDRAERFASVLQRHLSETL
ncbi:MAG: hypothetical protein AAGG01_15305 [Planctomycetota bacterium]